MYVYSLAYFDIPFELNMNEKFLFIPRIKNCTWVIDSTSHSFFCSVYLSVYTSQSNLLTTVTKTSSEQQERPKTTFTPSKETEDIPIFPKGGQKSASSLLST